MRIVDSTVIAASGGHIAVPIAERHILAVHRCGLGETAKEIAAAYRGGCPDAALATGGKMPYHLVIRCDGVIEQALPLRLVSPHARSWNRSAFAVALVGDFRHKMPTTAQIIALRELCHTCSGWLGGPSHVKGHDELDGARKNEGKECPGRMLDMGTLREEVATADEKRVACRGIRL